MTKKEYIKANGWSKLVKELVDGAGYTVEEAVEEVYDMKTMTKEDFRKKYQ